MNFDFSDLLNKILIKKENTLCELQKNDSYKKLKFSYLLNL